MDDLSQAMKEATAYLDRQKDEKKEVQPKKKEVKSAPKPKVSAVKRKTMEVQSNPVLVLAYGGAIALGHPLGATGAKLTTQLLFEMKRRGEQFGMVTMCIGGGMGVAMAVQRA